MNRSRLPPRARAQLAAVAEGCVRVAPILGIPLLLRELGQEPEGVIRAAGVDPHVFDDPENHIDFASGGRLLAHCAAVTACPHFGLLLGRRTGLDALGLVGVLAQHSPDLGSGLRNLILHLLLHDRGAVPILTVEAERALLGYAIYQPGTEGIRQIYDMAMAICHNIVKALCGPGWRPTEVRFPHSKLADTEPFARFFKAPLLFNAERAVLVFAAADMHLPLPGSDPALCRLLEERIAALEESAQDDIVAQVRRVLRNLLLSGQGSLDQVAEVFAIHRRTLNRRMRERGVTFRNLVEEARFDIARQLLRETDLAAVGVAAVLDYGDAAAFTRAFRRWSGTTPAAWRKAQGGS